MLEEATEEGFDDIIALQPGGESFLVRHTGRFTEQVMQEYFAQTKYKSFQRQRKCHDHGEEITTGVYHTKKDEHFISILLLSLVLRIENSG
jgi:hypothetical protein